MRRNILKSLLVTLGTLIGTVLLGLIGVSRRADVILPTWLIPDRGAGWGIAAAGLVLSLVTAVLILRYFIFTFLSEISYNSFYSNGATILTSGPTRR